MKNGTREHLKNEEDILEIENLKVSFSSSGVGFPAVDGISLSLKEGKTLGIVGKSGSGKSVTSLSVLGLNDKAKTEGKILFRKKNGEVMNLLGARERELEAIRGSEIAMVFQEPGSALNPVLKVGKSLEKVIRLHEKDLSRSDRKDKAKKLLEKVGFEDPDRIYDMFPHELSGGMKQRIVIAMALSSSPKLIIADEPTTALDQTMESEILKLLEHLVEENGVSMILISHDLGVISRLSDSIVVMKDGLVVEEGLKKEILTEAQHPYTKELLDMARSMEWFIKRDHHADQVSLKGCTPLYNQITKTHRVLSFDKGDVL